MRERRSVSGYLIGGGGALLVLTAAVQAGGYPGVAQVLGVSGLDPFLKGAFKVLWLVLSVQLVFVGAVLLLSAAKGGLAV